MNAAGSTTDDQYHRERNHSISWDTVGTMQSAQSRIRTLDVAVYQRPALILRVEITTLKGFLTGMLITGVAIYKVIIRIPKSQILCEGKRRRKIRLSDVAI